MGSDLIYLKNNSVQRCQIALKFETSLWPAGGFSHRWMYGDWSPCSVTCGEGVQTRELSCKQEISSTLTMKVNEAACLTPAPSLSKVRTCSQAPCAKWHAADWGKVRAIFTHLPAKHVCWRCRRRSVTHVKFGGGAAVNLNKIERVFSMNGI